MTDDRIIVRSRRTGVKVVPKSGAKIVFGEKDSPVVRVGGGVKLLVRIGVKGEPGEDGINSPTDFLAYLASLPYYDSDDSAIAGGLSVGDFYMTLPGPSLPGGLLKQVEA